MKWTITELLLCKKEALRDKAVYEERKQSHFILDISNTINSHHDNCNLDENVRHKLMLMMSLMVIKLMIWLMSQRKYLTK